MKSHCIKTALLAAALAGALHASATPSAPAGEGGQPENDLKLVAASMPKYVLRGEKIKYYVQIVNNGSAPVTSVTAQWLKDGQAVAEETVSGLDVAPQQQGSFALGSFALDQEGDYDIALKISRVNGKEDERAEDNLSPTVRTYCRSKLEKRKTLLEFFSTEKCTACPSAHYAIDEALDGKDGLVEIGHHAGYKTDRYTIAESTAMEWFYRSGNTYAPAIMVDRNNVGGVFSSLFADNVPVVGATAENAQALYEESQSVPALVSVNMSASIDNRKLYLNVSGKQLLPIDTPDSVRLYVYLTEDSIYTGNQAGAGSSFYHRFSARKSLTPTWGEAIDVAGYSGDFSFYIPKTWNIANVRVVAFVANYNATDKNDCRVLNTEELRVSDAQNVTGIGEHRPRDDAFWQLVSASGVVLDSGSGAEKLASSIARQGHGLLIIRTKDHAVKVFR